MTETSAYDLAPQFLEQLLRLRAAGAFEPRETAPGRGVFRWRFRAGGWPVSVDLDASVLEIRVYHDRDEVAMGRVPANLLDVLVGRAPVPAGVGPAKPDEVLAALRAIVGVWKTRNARIFVRPPVKVGHPDNWNDA